MAPPVLTGIDHVHVYVPDRDAGRQWYETVLGLRPVEDLLFWAEDGGPLVLEDATGSVDIALFEADRPPGTAIAFGTTADAFLAWREHLASAGVETRLPDHTVCFSLYFADPFGNYHEITCNEYDILAARLDT